MSEIEFEVVTTSGSEKPPDKPSEKKIPKGRIDGQKSIDRHAKAGELLRKWAPNHVGSTWARSEGRWVHNRQAMQKMDTVLSRSTVPTDEDAKLGYDGRIAFFRFGDAYKGTSFEVIPYMARYSVCKGSPFNINCPRADGLTPEQAPIGLAPFKEEAMWNREMAEQYIDTYVKYVGGPFILIHMVGPTLDDIQWVWIRRIWGIPYSCFSIYSVPGDKRNRIIVKGHKDYIYCAENYETPSLFGNRSEPETTIIETLTPPKGFVPYNGLYIQNGVIQNGGT